MSLRTQRVWVSYVVEANDHKTAVGRVRAQLRADIQRDRRDDRIGFVIAEEVERVRKDADISQALLNRNRALLTSPSPFTVPQPHQCIFVDQLAWLTRDLQAFLDGEPLPELLS